MAMNIKLKLPKYLKSVKYCLGAVNCLFLVTGLLLLIVGIVVLVQFKQYDLLITKKFLTIPGFAIGTAIIIFLVGGLGFFAAFSEKFYAIAAYVVLQLIVMVFELSITIASFNLKKGAVSEIRTPMLQSLQLYSTRRDIAKLWDDLQMEFECCGVAGRNDYISNQIPISCCHIDYGTISPFECGILNAYNVGCASILGEWLSYSANALAITSLVLTCLQALMTAASAWLAWRSKFEEVELES